MAVKGRMSGLRGAWLNAWFETADHPYKPCGIQERNSSGLKIGELCLAEEQAFESIAETSTIRYSQHLSGLFRQFFPNQPRSIRSHEIHSRIHHPVFCHCALSRRLVTLSRPERHRSCQHDRPASGGG